MFGALAGRPPLAFMPPLELSAAHARRFLLRRQLLSPPRALAPSPASVLSVVERLGSLQFDPLEVPGAKSHDLVLHARIGGYARAYCDGLLYAPRGQRRLFEAYNKSLNILPAHELPYHRLAWEKAEERYRARIFQERAGAVEAILERLRREGPLATAAVSKRMGAPLDWHWAPTAEGRAVLEALFESGRVGIARRDGSRKTYDLIERLFPEELLARRVAPAEALRHRLLSRYRGVGLMGSVASAELTHGAGNAAQRVEMTAALVEAGVLVPAVIEGVRGLRYLLAEERPILAAAEEPLSARGVAFLAPLDPLLWDRRLVRALFGFDYIWEVYVPEPKRRYGYYVLPILFGERLVGRIEPRFERKAEALAIVGLAFEPGFDPLGEPGFLAAFAEALDAYARFVGAKKVTFPRARIAAAVARACRALEARAKGGIKGRAPCH
jgi:uncharacterized protein YcaQ